MLRLAQELDVDWRAKDFLRLLIKGAVEREGIWWRVTESPSTQLEDETADTCALCAADQGTIMALRRPADQTLPAAFGPPA